MIAEKYFCEKRELGFSNAWSSVFPLFHLNTVETNVRKYHYKEYPTSFLLNSRRLSQAGSRETPSDSHLPPAPGPFFRVRKGWGLGWNEFGFQSNKLHLFLWPGKGLCSLCLLINGDAWANSPSLRKIPEKINLEEDMLILIRCCRGFIPWSLSPVALETYRISTADLLVAAREQKGSPNIPLKDTTLMT